MSTDTTISSPADVRPVAVWTPLGRASLFGDQPMGRLTWGGRDVTGPITFESARDLYPEFNVQAPVVLDVRESPEADAICAAIVRLADASLLSRADVIDALVSRFGFKLDTSPHDDLVAAAAELGIDLRPVSS